MTVGLPSFRGLVTSVYDTLGENWDLHPAEREVMDPKGRLFGQYDRVLRSLERRLTAPGTGPASGLRKRLRNAIRAELKSPSPDQELDLGVHLALLMLSRDAESKTRLVTTNFDTLFERAWPREGGIPSFAGAAMPQPKTVGCAGVLHLHGRLADTSLGLSETDLVLTSAEFGEAYLRSGWASRYVYDLVRAYTVVLVGYQADDPPMRYLLEVLEADRQRYADLRKVYAFANVDEDEALTRALWEAKGVEPILHTLDADGSYGPLYRTILEWRAYAEDPTAWRRAQLKHLFAADSAASSETVRRVVELLQHGDASLLLSELNPPAEWLSLLRQQRIFDGGRASPGAWIAARIDDPDMIRAAAAHPSFDEQTVWYVERALEENRDELGPVRARAWEILVGAKQKRDKHDYDHAWFRHVRRIREGETGYQIRRVVAHILRPTLKARQPFWLHNEAESETVSNETLHSFMSLDFEPTRHVNAGAIVDAWPNDETPLVQLVQTLERALLDALEHAEDVGFISGSDRDVPSIAPHAQNAYRNGFYPIIRVIADLWERLAQSNRERAIAISRTWPQAQFVLVRRLAIFAATNATHPAQDLAEAIIGLNDHDFWVSGAQVELMRGLVARWEEFADQTRQQIEARISAGIPRCVFDDDAFDAERWQIVWDRAVYRRLARLTEAGKRLGTDSNDLLAQITMRRPNWHPGSEDRDDFHSWHESLTGPDGDIDLLTGVPDATLVKEALRIEREKQFDQGDLWRKFCSSDPDRAFRGLVAENHEEGWNAYAWRALISATGEPFESPLRSEIADAMLAMPDTVLNELSHAIADWLRVHRKFLDNEDSGVDSRLWLLWDLLAERVFVNDTAGNPQAEDLITLALNLPGGVLACLLIDHLAASNPAPGAGLGGLESRFNIVTRDDGEAGLLGRVHFASRIGYLHQTAPDWTNAEMLPRFRLENAEALAMWKANSQEELGPADLFNSVKVPLLAVIPRPELSDSESGNLATRLLSVLVQHQAGSAVDYDLDPVEVRDLLAKGPARLREHFAWLLWRLQGDATEGQGIPADKAARWQKLVGPIFEQIWPLDARLRSEGTSENLVQLLLQTGEAFPDAVGAVVDVLGPYELYLIEHTFKLEAVHADLVERYPKAGIRLTNALVDPTLHPVPRDLGKLLDQCEQIAPEIVNDPMFLRLSGFRRLGSA